MTHGGGGGFCVGNAQIHARGAEVVLLYYFRREHIVRRAVVLVADFDLQQLVDVYAAADRLEKGFLGAKNSGDGFRRVVFLADIIQFAARKDALHLAGSDEDLDAVNVLDVNSYHLTPPLMGFYFGNNRGCDFECQAFIQ